MMAFLSQGKKRFLESKRQYRFGKSRKIKRKKEITGLLKAEKRWNSSNFKIYNLENRINRNRIAIIVPKSAGTAVERNKIKRRVREYFRKNFQNATPHIDILVKIHPAKETNKSMVGLEKALALWFETGKK